MSLILSGTEGISGSAGVIDAETFAGQANTYYTDISSRLGYTPLSNVNPSYSGTLTGNTGIINIGSGQFYKDASGNVGINTSSPLTKFEVQGGRSTFTANSEPFGVAARFSTAGGSVYFGAASASATPDTVFSAATGDERMRITNAGSVGIGTASPTARLSVSGVTPLLTGGNGQLSVFSTDAIGADKGGKISFGGVSGAAGFDPYGFCAIAGLKDNATPSNFSGYLTFSTAIAGGTVTERMRITSAGNVGIGTTSPGAKLEIFAGTSSVADFTSLRMTNGGENGTNLDFYNAFGPLAQIKGTKEGSGAAADEGIITFSTATNSVLSEKMRITSAGNVGIGTSSPTGKLDLFTSSTVGSISNVTFSALNAASAKKDYVQLVPSIEFNTAGSEAGGYTLKVLQQGAYKNSIVAEGITNNSSNYLAFSTTNEAMRITSAGKVGIGTTAPTNKLEVVGGGNNAAFFSSASGTTQINIATFSNSTNSGFLFIAGVGSASVVPSWANGSLVLEGVPFSSGNTILGSYTGALIFQTNDRAERMRIDSSGNLLVGTTTVIAKLGVLGAGSTSATFAFAALNSGGFDLFTARNDGLLSTGTRASSPYNNTTASAANVFVNTDGTLARSTSSLKYKTSVEDSTHGLVELLTLRPVTYKGKSEHDGDKVFGGLIAEEVHEAGLTEFVQYAEDGTPDALSYGNMISLCIKAIQEQQAMITELKAEFDAYKLSHL